MESIVRGLKIGGVAIALAATTGCATQANLTVRSQPDGAYLTEVGSGKAFGMAPRTVYYDKAVLQQHRNAQGCFMVKGVEARWASGVTATLDPIRLCGGATGGYSITLQRDPKLPGFEKDLQFSMQIQSLRAQQQQAQAAEDAANAALWSAFESANQNTTSNRINCTSMAMGTMVQTNCY